MKISTSEDTAEESSTSPKPAISSAGSVMASELKYRVEYERRLHRVLAYIDAHLDQPIALAHLAKEANFSVFHFHRLFAAQVGQTLGSYLTRRRLEQAATRLAAQPQLSVLEVALAVGFGSSEAFTRAFKKHFGCAPSIWKTQPPRPWYDKGKMSQAKSNLDQAMAEEKRYSPGMETLTKKPMRVEIITRSPVRFAYLRYQGPFGKPAGRFWQDQVIPWLISSNLVDRPKYGVSQDDPEVTDETKCRYDAGAEVDEKYVPSQGAQIAVIPGGLYATTAFRGTPEDMPPAWQRLLREWLPASGYQLDARPCFEYYPLDQHEHDESTGVFTGVLCIPIAKL